MSCKFGNSSHVWIHQNHELKSSMNSNVGMNSGLRWIQLLDEFKFSMNANVRWMKRPTGRIQCTASSRKWVAHKEKDQCGYNFKLFIFIPWNSLHIIPLIYSSHCGWYGCAQAWVWYWPDREVGVSAPTLLLIGLVYINLINFSPMNAL